MSSAQSQPTAETCGNEIHAWAVQSPSANVPFAAEADTVANAEKLSSTQLHDNINEMATCIGVMRDYNMNYPADPDSARRSAFVTRAIYLNYIFSHILLERAINVITRHNLNDELNSEPTAHTN